MVELQGVIWQLYTAYKIKHTKYCGVFGLIYSTRQYQIQTTLGKVYTY